MWLQAAIKKTFEGNPRMTIQEFIGALEGSGINLQFNQASTGYVSGISYGYQGFLVIGSKLGNDFKWTTIKNRIDYEQERDRSGIQQANDRTRTIMLESGKGIGNHVGSLNPIPEKSKSFYLPARGFSAGVASILDGVSHEDSVHLDNVPHDDNDPLHCEEKGGKTQGNEVITFLIKLDIGNFS